eukprot:TRINITY_DN153_c0_g2_i1.p1 TRINITY_DN153_c0_g2~~TRINITY_DN153_c0_g2_i1.p1  ORF type:complete len:234 (+),score=48.93 TRINITY_DN153_c0_g2_i1:233-934(+)
MSDVESELRSYLKKTQILSAWHTFLLELLEEGAPNGNVYDFAASCLLKYRDDHKGINNSVDKKKPIDENTQSLPGTKKSFPDKSKSQEQQNQVELIKEWFEASINSLDFGRPVFSSKNIIQDLKDGFLLCTFVNSLQPNQIHNIHSNPTTESEMAENISNFLGACSSVGVSSQTLFSPPDLIEERNIKKVLLCIVCYISELEKMGLKPKHLKTENINLSNLLHNGDGTDEPHT